MRLRYVIGTSVVTLTALLGNPVLAQNTGGGGRGIGQGETQPDTRPTDRRGGQRMERAPQLSATELQSAWTLEAQGVAFQLDLDEAATNQLVAVYLKHRQAFGDNMQKFMGEMRNRRTQGQDREHGQDRERGQQRGRPGRGGDARGGDRPDDAGGQGGRAERRERGSNPFFEMQAKQREALNTDLAGILSAEQLNKVGPLLGSFSQNWDRMVHSITALGLDETGLVDALNAVNTYVTSTTAARAMAPGGPQRGRPGQGGPGGAGNTDAAPNNNDGVTPSDAAPQRGRGGGGNDGRARERGNINNDRRPMMGAEQREALYAKLAEILNEEQLATFKKATAAPGRPDRAAGADRRGGPTDGGERGGRGRRGGQRGGG